MISRSKIRKEAYLFILRTLGNLSTPKETEKWTQCISLEELRLMKEGLADPSPTLLKLLKTILGGTLSKETFNAHLITPFEAHTQKEIKKIKGDHDALKK